MTSEDILAEDIERAIGRYMGMKEFPTHEWPQIAGIVSEIIAKAYVYNPNPYAAASNAKDLVEALGQLADHLAKVMT